MTSEIEDWVADYNNGLSYEQIAKKSNKSKRWIQKSLNGKIVARQAKRKPVIYTELGWLTTEERDQLICKLHLAGDGTTIIGKKLKIDKATARRVLLLRKIHKPRIGGGIVDHEKANILYNSGLTLAEVAKKFNVSEGAIRYHIEIPRTDADVLSAIPFDKQDQVVKWYLEKWSTYKIADELGLPYQSIQHFIKRKGISVGSFTQAWKEAVQRGLNAPQSRLEKHVSKILSDANIDHESQFQLEDLRYDFGIANGNILIEVQGSYWHKDKNRTLTDAYKRRVATKHHKKLLVIWDYELAKPINVLAKITNALSPPMFGFKQCSIKEATDWSTIKTILREHHYQGSGRAGYSIVAKFNDEVYGIVVFTTPSRQEIYKKQRLQSGELYELSRLAIVPRFQSRNFATWLLARAIKQFKISHHDAKRLIAFSDPTFGHIGTVYKANNWSFDGMTPASYWYYHRRKNTIFHKKTIWNAAKISGKTEEEHAKKLNLIKVLGQPKLRFILNLK